MMRGSPQSAKAAKHQEMATLNPPEGSDRRALDDGDNSNTKLILPFSIGQSVCANKDHIRELIRYGVAHKFQEIILFGADECQKYTFQLYDKDFYKATQRERTVDEALIYAKELGDAWELLCKEILGEPEFSNIRNNIIIKRWNDFKYTEEDTEKIENVLISDDKFSELALGSIDSRARNLVSKKNGFKTWSEKETALAEKYATLSRAYILAETSHFITWPRQLKWPNEENKRLAVRYPGKLEANHLMRYLAEDLQLLSDSADTSSVKISFEALAFKQQQEAGAQNARSGGATTAKQDQRLDPRATAQLDPRATAQFLHGLGSLLLASGGDPLVRVEAARALAAFANSFGKQENFTPGTSSPIIKSPVLTATGLPSQLLEGQTANHDKDTHNKQNK